MSTKKEDKASFWDRLSDFLISLIDIREDVDKVATIESIKKYIEIKGYNVWILLASAMIASIGLDMNAPAVIIGAMLISPLMSPILGLGLSVGINDRETLWMSLQNFLIAITVSVLSSFLYFRFATPFGILTPELAARTNPTLLDVGVALFGGIAGIVASSHPDKTNAIPGVAIATALMPPLCTVGFGLAKNDFTVWGGALYLFFINAVIIATTTYAFVRFLNFPVKSYQDPVEKRRSNYFITVFVLLVIVPSAFILLDTVQKIQRNNEVNEFIKTHVNNGKRESLRWDFVEKDGKPVIKINIVGERISDSEVAQLLGNMRTYRYLSDDSLWLIQNTVSPDDIDKVRTSTTEDLMQIREEIAASQQSQQEEMQNFFKKIQVMEGDSLPIREIDKELKALFPELGQIGIAQIREVTADSLGAISKLPSISLQWDEEQLKDKSKEDYEKRIYAFLKLRLKCDTLDLRSLEIATKNKKDD